MPNPPKGKVPPIHVFCYPGRVPGAGCWLRWGGAAVYRAGAGGVSGPHPQGGYKSVLVALVGGRAVPRRLLASVLPPAALAPAPAAPRPVLQRLAAPPQVACIRPPAPVPAWRSWRGLLVTGCRASAWVPSPHPLPRHGSVGERLRSA